MLVISKSRLFNYILAISSQIFCFTLNGQLYSISNELNIPKYRLLHEFSNFHLGENSQKKSFNLEFRLHFISNNGHANIDNFAEFYSPSNSSRMLSSRISLVRKWFNIEIEPYMISHSKLFQKESIDGSLGFNNNHVINVLDSRKIYGLKQSRIVIHYNGLGFGYGNMSHWWGPGFHSTLALSSNAPSQKTLSFGTFREFSYKDISFGSKIIIMPYKSSRETQLYFSGFKSEISYNSDSSIITFGVNRTFLSGNIEDLQSSTNFSSEWLIGDAARLLLDPLFGNNKKNSSYTIVGTPGFNAWDELLSGYFNINIIDHNLDFYIEIASDDSRANFVDLRAHWDHTIAYVIGFKKLSKNKRLSFFYGAEYLSTKISNTFNPLFYRGGPNSINYYTRGVYDYFSYKGRRMGAHSGSSSDDLIFLYGFRNETNTFFITFNRERHGIKSMNYPELKSEVILSYQKKISKNINTSISFENEIIQNFGFTKDNKSTSNLVWLSLNYSMM